MILQRQRWGSVSLMRDGVTSSPTDAQHHASRPRHCEKIVFACDGAQSPTEIRREIRGAISGRAPSSQEMLWSQTTLAIPPCGAGASCYTIPTVRTPERKEPTMLRVAGMN